jgi:hypothetical protein
MGVKRRLARINGLTVMNLGCVQVVLAASRYSNAVLAFRVADGEILCRTAVAGPRFITSDPMSGNVVVSESVCVEVFRWDGGSLMSTGPVPGAGKQAYDAPLAVAVVPASAGEHTSHLVVAEYGADSIRVFSLPLFQLIATTRLPVLVMGTGSTPRILGLAADPWGTYRTGCRRARPREWQGKRDGVAALRHATAPLTALPVAEWHTALRGLLRAMGIT